MYQILISTGIILMLVTCTLSAETFEGRHYRGAGDTEYLQLLDVSRRMMGPDPQYQNLAMLYEPAWNGFVEGPRWDAWWIQNSYGATYCALPFFEEPWLTFLQNAQDLWFDQMGDGRRAGEHGWVPPDGALCDAARPGWVYYKQGDGRIDIHDWAVEFTAAGVVMQAELLLIGRDRDAIAKYLPKLKRCADFLESRRDPDTNLMLAGPAGNLLAPSYAGWRKPDGTFGMAYLAGLSVTYIAALDRLIEVAKLGGDDALATEFAARRERVRSGLPKLMTDDGYFVKSIDPDGTRHGVFGADKHGYFETPPNHDAMAFRVVDDAQAKRIYDKIVSIPQLRPHQFIIPNYPSYDDMYTEPVDYFEYGRWINGGHWSTCEARMILGYYRVGAFDDVRRSMRQLMTFADRFQLDNPLPNFGSAVWWKDAPINLCYDSFGPPAAMMRGLFEFLYSADGVTLVPHIPPGITWMEQRSPVRLGEARLFIATVGTGPITQVLIDRDIDMRHDGQRVFIPAHGLEGDVKLLIAMGGAEPAIPHVERPEEPLPTWRDLPEELDELKQMAQRLDEYLSAAGGDEAVLAHARVALASIDAIAQRRAMLAEGKIAPLPPESQEAADQVYVDAAHKLVKGWEARVDVARND